METRRLGKSDLEITPCVLGTWQFDSDTWEGIEDAESIKTLHKAIEVGINLLDTAVGYGRSEEVVGMALEGKRDQIQILSKCFVPAAEVAETVDNSLKAMKTDYIDIYMAHYPAHDEPVADQVIELDKLREAGKIRAIGVSNFSLDQMKETLAAVRIDAYEPPFNAFWREIELNGTMDFCKENEIAILTYSSMAQGLLAGKFLDGEVPKDIHAGNKLYQPGTIEKCIEVAKKVKEIADAHGKSMAQTALNWNLHYPGITACICGAERPWQIEDTIGSLGWSLTDEETELISSLGMEIANTLDYDTNMWGWRPGL